MKIKASSLNNSTLLTVLLTATWLLTTFKVRTFELWHLLASGKIFFEKPTLSFTEELSYTVAGQSWVNQEWLGEAILYLIYTIGGFAGLITLKSIVVCVTVWMLFRHMTERGANPLAIFWILFVTVFMCRFRLTVRPQIFSFFFITYLAQLLYHYKIGRRQSLWVVIPMMFVWTNIHFGSLLGLVLIGIYIAAAFLAVFIPRFFDGNLIRPVNREMFFHLAIVFVGSLLVSFINPGTYQYLSMPLEVGFLSVKFRVLESLPVRLFSVTVFPLFWVSLIVYVGIVLKTMKKIDIFDLLIFLVSAAMALKMARFIALYAILSAPVVIQQWSLLISKKKLSARLLDAISQRATLIVITLVCVVGAAVLNVGILRKYQFGYGMNQELQPVEAAKFLRDNNVTGNIYNDINWGGYLAYQLNPQNRVFMYARYSVFRDYIYDAYYRVLRGEPQWQEILNQYRTEIILLSKPVADIAPLTAELTNALNWNIIYDDDKAVIYVKNRPRFRGAIQAYKNKAVETEVNK